MTFLVQSAVTFLAATLFGGQPAPKAPTPETSAATFLSAQEKFALTDKLSPERPTLFFFYRENSAMEIDAANSMEKSLMGLVGLRWVPLKTGDEPLAKQVDIMQTPTAILYDRRGRLVVRTSNPNELRPAINKALSIMRIDWAADDDPRMDQIERILGRRVQGGIMRTMSFQPEWLNAIQGTARKAHFSPAKLDVRTHEMIASYVSGLNKCKF
jgi:hypothetical protein